MYDRHDSWVSAVGRTAYCALAASLAKGRPPSSLILRVREATSVSVVTKLCQVMWNQNPTERRRLTINYAQASDQPFASIAFILQAPRTQEAIESVVS
jgi:hypothetical protein